MTFDRKTFAAGQNLRRCEAVDIEKKKGVEVTDMKTEGCLRSGDADLGCGGETRSEERKEIDRRNQVIEEEDAKGKRGNRYFKTHIPLIRMAANLYQRGRG